MFSESQQIDSRTYDNKVSSNLDSSSIVILHIGEHHVLDKINCQFQNYP